MIDLDRELRATLDERARLAPPPVDTRPAIRVARLRQLAVILTALAVVGAVVVGSIVGISALTRSSERRVPAGPSEAPFAAARSDHIEDDQETRQKLDIHYADININRAGGSRIAVFKITTYKRWEIEEVSDPMFHRVLFGADFDSRGGKLAADYSVSVRGLDGIICELHRYGEDQVLVSVDGTKGPRAVTCSFGWRRLHATRTVRWRVWSSTWGQLDRAPDLGYSTI